MTEPIKADFHITQVDYSQSCETAAILGTVDGHQFQANLYHRCARWARGESVQISTLLIRRIQDELIVFKLKVGFSRLPSDPLVREQDPRDISLFLQSGVIRPFFAIKETDLWIAEAVRGRLVRPIVPAIADFYRRLEDWGEKDMAVHILQDCKPRQVHEVMLDAIRSPDPITRAKPSR